MSNTYIGAYSMLKKKAFCELKKFLQCEALLSVTTPNKQNIAMQCRGKWAIGKTLLVEQRHLDGDAIITALLNKDGSIG